MYTAPVRIQAPSAATASTPPVAASAPAPAPTAQETVVRPPPGLARGVWEARPWLFYVIAAAVVVAALGYALRRAGAADAWRRRRARRTK